ncbi:unnamed protein product [Mytilus coruscus]|uniref:Uncharacterized protein n=1 Tax=Mytilus coruscus TaxID=42192 RepID=A0A6J8CHR0_MYTCO|nr:unnamed protein product [Mytilus coruscus]
MLVQTLVIVVLYSVKTKYKGLFNSCQPQNCRKKDLKGLEINNTKVEDTTQILWINAYVVRSQVMEYYGCYKVAVPSQTLHQLDQWQNDTDNNVLKCSRFCKSKGYALKGYVILLQCVAKSTFIESKDVLMYKRSSILKKFQGNSKQNNLYENNIGLEQQVYRDLTPVREDTNSPYDVIHKNNSPLYENDIGLEQQIYQDLTPGREDTNKPYDEIHNYNTF